MRREQHTEVSRHAREDQRARAQVLEQQIERRELEARVLRLQHEIVVIVRREQLGDRRSRTAAPRDVLQQHPEIGAPAAEIVVHVHRGNAGLLRAPLQRANCARRGARARQHLFRPFEVEGVDHVGDQQRRARVVRRVALQIAAARARAMH